MASYFSVPLGRDATESNWIQRTQLDGVDFIFRLLWSQRDGHWGLDIADQDSVPIASGLKLVTGQSLLGTCVDPRKPAGDLIVADTLARDDLDPGFDDLGTRFLLLYVTA